MANRSTRAKGHEPCGLEGQVPYFPRGTLRPWGDKLSTTRVLDLRTGQDPYLPRRISSSLRRRIVDYYGTRSLDGTRSLSPKKNLFIHKTTIDRLPRYSILEWDKIPTSQEKSLRSGNNELSTTPVFDLWRGQVPYLWKGSLHPWDDNWSTTRSSDGTTSLSSRT